MAFYFSIYLSRSDINLSLYSNNLYREIKIIYETIHLQQQQQQQQRQPTMTVTTIVQRCNAAVASQPM